MSPTILKMLIILSDKTSYTSGRPFLSPINNPSIINAPNDINTADGEFIPRRDLNAFISLIAMLLMISIGLKELLAKPFIKPVIIFPPKIMKSFDGEFIPRSPQKASIRFLAMPTIALVTFPTPDAIPLARPSTTLSPFWKVLDSSKPLIHSSIDSKIFFIKL